MLSGALAFVYAAALWYCAPLFSGDRTAIADRLRTAIIIGIAAPGALALLGILYAPALWVLLAMLAAVRTLRRVPSRATPADAALLLALACAWVALWPGLARPLLDGDTLLYHLPNAAAFVQDHTAWTARAPYWLYPPASEIFAAGLLCVSGRWSLPLAGIFPALLIVSRLYTAARNAGAKPAASAALALAFICMPLAAFQTGTLQNDLWLAAFFTELLCAGQGAASFAICALLKPFGWLEAFVAAAAARLPVRSVLLGLLPLAVWILRDGVLLGAGGRAGFSAPPYLEGIIAAHPIAFLQLAHGIAAVTPQSFVWLALLAPACAFPQTRRYGFAGAASLVIYAFLPLAYRSGATNYALDASSFRFALPALAAGALAGAALIPRAQIAGIVLGYALALWGAYGVLAVYWNDAYTHWSIAVAAAAALAALASPRTRGLSVAIITAAALIVAAWSASSRAPGFYANWMPGRNGAPTGVFSWIASHRPRSVLAADVRIGAVFMASPHTRVLAAGPAPLCAQAVQKRALLLVGSNEDTGAGELAREFSDARRSCRVLYRDSAAILVRPR